MCWGKVNYSLGPPLPLPGAWARTGMCLGKVNYSLSFLLFLQKLDFQVLNLTCLVGGQNTLHT